MILKWIDELFIDDEDIDIKDINQNERFPVSEELEEIRSLAIKILLDEDPKYYFIMDIINAINDGRLKYAGVYDKIYGNKKDERKLKWITKIKRYLQK